MKLFTFVRRSALAGLFCLAIPAQAAVPGRAQPLKNSKAVPDGLSASDWQSIRGAYEAGRLAVAPTAEGYRARNPGQQWRTQFDGRGFLVEPEHASWRWGLELRDYGFAGQEHPRKEKAQVHAGGQGVVYRWDENLSEWYRNDQRGLEHGFTIEKRPAAAIAEQEEPLEIALAVRGDLTAEVVPGGKSVRFVDRKGMPLITYSELQVWDAEHKRVAAEFAPEKDGVRIRIEERAARYPLTIDPIAQQAYLKASNTDSGDQFGWAVAISGDTVVISAPAEDSRAKGINGDQTDNRLENAGAAYVFVRNGGTWTQEAYLKASNTDKLDFFGFAVAISDDTIVIGAPDEDSSATGVNGDQSDNRAISAGAAYVFVRSNGIWTQEAYLKASNTDGSDAFGGSVAVSGDTIVVGAKTEASSATGVNGDQSDNSAFLAGAAYVFVRNDGIWTQEAYLKASNTEGSDAFGHAVAISDDTIVIGATGEDSSATGVNGNQSDNSATAAGATYVFVRSGGTWTQQAYLKASNTESFDDFGDAVAISGDTVVIGADGEDSSATGVNGDQTNNSANAAYVFVRSNGTWSQDAYLKASNTNSPDQFGRAVAVSGDTIVIGAYFEASSATGVDGDQTDNSALEAGAAYVFARSGGAWTQEAYLKASNTDAFDNFGNSVAVSGDTIVIGALAEASSATGVNGDQSDNSAGLAGAALRF